MVEISAILTFPKDLMNSPFISKLIKERDIDINILQAYITPEQDGQMHAIFSGEEGAVESSLDLLRQRGVYVVLPVQNLVWEQQHCVHCGACTGQCASGALSIDPVTFAVSYDKTCCIACELCIPACSYGAIESVSDHLRKTGEL
jgi:ferredoxin